MNGTPPARPLPLFATLGVMAFTFLWASPMHAAVITWDTPTTISADTDISTAGSLHYAYTFGNLLVSDTTVNGVAFTPFAVPNLSSASVTVGSVTLAVSPEFSSENSSTGSNVPPFSELSENYQKLLESQVSVTPNFSEMTLTMGGLTIGQDYLVQFWSNDSGSFMNRWGETIYTAGNAVEVDNSIPNHLGGVGQWVTGSFTANASEQVVTIKSSTLTGDYPVMNAMQLRVVPEPSSALLWVSGAMLCLRRRRKVA